MVMEPPQDGRMLASPQHRPRSASEIWWIERGDMFREFGVRVSPYAILVDAEGRVVSKGLVNHHSDIKRMLKEAREAQEPAWWSSRRPSERLARTRSRSVAWTREGSDET